MREGLRKSDNLREASRRVTVLVVVISGHLGLLMLLLRPVIFYRDATMVIGNNLPVLKLRFIQPLQLSSRQSAFLIHRLTALAVRSHTASSARPSMPSTIQQVVHADAQPNQVRLTGAPGTDASEGNSTDDGGFQARLYDARHSYSVRGVPGSDTRFAAGIHLVDPMSQGVGAVMRTAQRAFGIKNSHCIDVDVWRHLAPQELSARHISSGDVDEVDEKYDCNKPPGLHF